MESFLNPERERLPKRNSSMAIPVKPKNPFPTIQPKTKMILYFSPLNHGEVAVPPVPIMYHIPGSIFPGSEFMEEVPVGKMLYPPSSTTENFTKPQSATVDAMTTGWIKFGGTRHGWEKSALTMNKAPMFSTPIN